MTEVQVAQLRADAGEKTVTLVDTVSRARLALQWSVRSHRPSPLS